MALDGNLPISFQVMTLENLKRRATYLMKLAKSQSHDTLFGNAAIEDQRRAILKEIEQRKDVGNVDSICR